METSQRSSWLLRLGFVAGRFVDRLLVLLVLGRGLEHGFEFLMLHALGALAVTAVSGLALLGHLSHLLSGDPIVKEQLQYKVYLTYQSICKFICLVSRGLFCLFGLLIFGSIPKLGLQE